VSKQLRVTLLKLQRCIFEKESLIENGSSVEAADASGKEPVGPPEVVEPVPGYGLLDDAEGTIGQPLTS